MVDALGGWCIVAKCCWYLLAIQGSSMVMRIILFIGAMLWYIISLINNPYMIIIKWELDQNREGRTMDKF